MNKQSSHIGTFLLGLTVIALLAILTMMFGARMGLWEPIVGFGLIRQFMNPIAYALFGLGLAGLIYQKVTKNRAGIIKTSVVTLVGFALLAPMIYGLVVPSKRAPAIHDITTNTDNPPVFLVLDETRKGAKNSLVYAGQKDAMIQKKAYPHIAPIQSELDATAAFNKALEIAKQMNWEIVAQDSETLRFEAIARTSVFAFMDDVVVVVTPIENKSRIDIRSVSRIGRSDQGVNAARITKFTQAFKD